MRSVLDCDGQFRSQVAAVMAEIFLICPHGPIKVRDKEGEEDEEEEEE